MCDPRGRAKRVGSETQQWVMSGTYGEGPLFSSKHFVLLVVQLTENKRFHFIQSSCACDIFIN